MLSKILATFCHDCLTVSVQNSLSTIVYIAAMGHASSLSTNREPPVGFVDFFVNGLGAGGCISFLRTTIFNYLPAFVLRIRIGSSRDQKSIGKALLAEK